MSGKINGYTKEEAQNFIKFICAGKESGKTLTCLFGEYAKSTDRAQGSVRNYYYNLLKSTDNEEVKTLLKGKNLHAEKICEFTDEETDAVLKEILRQKSEGVSVRRAVINLSGGDDKLMLRYQNKYRNTLAKRPEKIEALLKECKIDARSDAQRAIERQIDALYDKLATSLKEENKRLTVIIKRLTEENDLLRKRVKNLQA